MLPDTLHPAGQIHGQNDTSEQMILSFDSILPQPQATLTVDFDFTLRPGLEGLYRSQFTGTVSHCVMTMHSILSACCMNWLCRCDSSD